MKALYVILPIVFFIALILLSKVRFSLVYDGAVRLRISYLFVRIPLYPRKKRKPRRRKAPVKANKQSDTPTNTAVADTPPAKKEKSKKKKPLTFGDFRFLLRLFRDVLAHVLEKASRHVRITVKRLHLSIGGAEDAARAAIGYGAVSQSVAYLLEFLNETGFLKRPRPRAIAVGVNFLEKEHRLSFRTDVTCPLLFLIPLALSSLTKALTAKNRWSRYRGRTAKKAHDKNEQKKENDNG